MYLDAVPPEYWVHNLEHGAIVVLYECPNGAATCADSELVRQLGELYRDAPPGKCGEVKMVVTQYPGLEPTLVALAWNRKLELDQFDKERLLRFYRDYVDKGPEDVP